MQAGIAGEEGFAGRGHAGNAHHETLLLTLPKMMRSKDPDPLPLFLYTDVGNSELPRLNALQPVRSIAAFRFARVAVGVGVSRKFLDVRRHRVGQLPDRERAVTLLPQKDVHAAI